MSLLNSKPSNGKTIWGEGRWWGRACIYRCHLSSQADGSRGGGEVLPLEKSVTIARIFVSLTSKLTRGMQGLVRHEILSTSLIIQVPWFLRLGVGVDLSQHQLSVLQPCPGFCPSQRLKQPGPDHLYPLSYHLLKPDCFLIQILFCP